MKKIFNGAVRNSSRENRVAAHVQTLVAEILRDKYMDDPVLSGVNLSGAVAHGGLSFVKLYFYTSGDAALVQKRLDDVVRAIRFELAARMNQKYVPDIKFQYDDTMERAERIEKLLQSVEFDVQSSDDK